MEEKEQKQRLFKSLLEKMYEKGEKEQGISTKDLIQDMEVELRGILSVK